MENIKDPILQIKDVCISYTSDVMAVKHVSADIEKNTITAIMGPSGCGKSTLLRAVNRMHELYKNIRVTGEILLNGENVLQMHPMEERRRIGMVFQRPNPFPTMSIRENVLAGVKLNNRKISKSDADDLVEWALRGANLWNEVKDRLDNPGIGLSGGQQQRLCIARAVAVHPQVLLMDEPCSALDPISTLAVEDLINELGVEVFRACDYTNMWYNGPYVVEEFISQNTKSYIPNPNYYAADEVSRFDRFTVTMISDGTVTFQLYQNRELDEMDVGESTLTTIQADPNSEYNAQLCEKRPKKFSYQMHFNYQKNNEDGTPDDNWNKAIANTAFRQCFYKGLNLTNWYARTNKINPLKCENDYYTMPGVCYNTQGQEYSTLVAKEMGFDGEAYDGKTMIRLRSNNGDIADLKKQAMEELSAIGVTFPVHCSYYILAGSTSALDSATVLKQCFTDSFGDDFIVLDVNTFVSSTMKEVVAPKLQSFVHMGWGADFGDPVNFLGQETLHDDNAFYSHYYSNIARVAEAPADYQKDLMDAFEQYTDLVNAANAIVNDTDARYEAFAKAEAYMLENVLVSPTYYDIAWSLTHANEYSKINAMYGGCNYKAVNWETSEEAYTTVQYEQFAKAFDAAIQG